MSEDGFECRLVQRLPVEPSAVLDISVGLGDDVDTFVTEKQVGPRATEILKTNLGLPPSQKAGSRRQGNFFTRKVPGWRWDQFQNGYIASAPNTFTCRCGSQFNVPSYYNCRCGSTWNAFVVGQGGDHRTAQIDQYICREVQPGVGIIMANRRTACGPNCDCEGCGEEREEKERKQSRRRQADWTVYDADVDPEDTGRVPPSTDAKKLPSDWARRDEKSRWVPPTFAPRPIR